VRSVRFSTPLELAIRLFVSVNGLALSTVRRLLTGLGVSLAQDLTIAAKRGRLRDHSPVHLDDTPKLPSPDFSTIRSTLTRNERYAMVERADAEL
jgi:hypothetical protein